MSSFSRSFFLSSLVFFIISSSSAIGSSDTARVQGQHQVNVLRHTVILSDLPERFGKQGHILLSRSVVPPHRIWEAADTFTYKTLSHPDRLDWYVADYSTDGRRTVTINAAFSCLDVGNSHARPLYWWASRDFSKLTNKSQEVGGAEVDTTAGGDGSINDITERCFNGRKPIDSPDFRLAERQDAHRGGGLLLTKKPLPRSVVNDYQVFEALRKQRLAEDGSNAVIFHESGLPVTLGLTFESGIRVWVPKNFTTDSNRDLKVPITPFAAITKHSGSRLEEARVAEGETSTNNTILILTVFSAGLPLLLAVWWVVKHICDTEVEHSRQCYDLHLPVHEAVERISGWTAQEKVLLIMNLVGATILATPFALAVAEGTIDPRISVEVTTGATVFVGSSQPELSEDTGNLFAGAPYVVTVWISVRHLGYGFVAALVGSLLVISFLSIGIVFQVSKKSNEMIPGSRSRWGGFSFWKLNGSLGLLRQSFKREAETRYQVLVELYDDFIDEEGIADVEGKKKEILIMQASCMREQANARFFRKRDRQQDQQKKREAREALYKSLGKHGRSRYRLLCKVRMDNRARYKAAMSQSTVYDRHLPREWEYVRRSLGCEGIDWYRTNGVMPPDKALIFARLGLLPYMKYVKKVVIKEDPASDPGDYDEDGVKTTLIVTPLESEFEDLNLYGEVPEARVLDDHDEEPNLFSRHMSSALLEVPWAPGTNKEAIKYGGGILHVNYIVMDETEAQALCSSV